MFLTHTGRMKTYQSYLLWSTDWGGGLQIEENQVDFKPGRFVIFKSNDIHNGVGPNKKIPYWRISINYIVKNG